MLKLKVHSELGICALQLLSESNGSLVRSADIALRLNAPKRLIEQVMARLTRHGMAGVQKGPRGGFKHISGKVTVWDVMCAMGEETSLLIKDDHKNGALSLFYNELLNTTTKLVVKE